MGLPNSDKNTREKREARRLEDLGKAPIGRVPLLASIPSPSPEPSNDPSGMFDRLFGFSDTVLGRGLLNESPFAEAVQRQQKKAAKMARLEAERDELRARVDYLEARLVMLEGDHETHNYGYDSHDEGVE